MTYICVRLFGAKPLSELTLEYFNWTLMNKIQWKLNRNSYIFIHENAFENVGCEMAAILSRPRYVNLNLQFGVLHLLSA